MSGNEARIYELITRHFLASLSADATGYETSCDIELAGEFFTASGLCIVEKNYLKVYIYDKWSETEIHQYEVIYIVFFFYFVLNIKLCFIDFLVYNIYIFYIKINKKMNY